MIRSGIETLARVAFLLVSLVVVGSCGSGAVGTPVTDPATIRILPDTAVLYSGLPTTFTVTGGTGAYIVTSSNQAVVPVAGPMPGTFTLIPNPVVADTILTLTARDTSTTTPATATLTVKPGTVSNNITVTPSSGDCAPAICSNGDAVVSTVISQGGIPLAARGVRFEVVSGDFRFITSPAGVPETSALSVLTTTDETGTARARIRVNNNAQNQTGILQVTDVATGAYQRATIFIAQASATVSGFFTVPDTLTFTGDRTDRCAIANISAQVFVFGGTPPYTIANTASTAFTITPGVLTASGQSFTVTPTGVCAEITIPVRDGSGRVVTVALKNQPGTAPVPTPTALVVSPTAVTLGSCTEVATVLVAGGNGSYNAASSRSFVMGTASGGSTSGGGSVSIRRVPGTDALGATSATVAVSDGTSITNVTVTLTGAATGNCP